MAASPEPCFTCNIFGCRILCLTPHQHRAGIVHFEDQDGQAQCGVQQTGGVPASQVFATKKRREIWCRNTLIVLYCLGGLGGLLLLPTVLVAPEIRSTSYSCRNVYMGMRNDLCSQGFLPDKESMQITDFLLLLNGCLTVLLAITGIFAAVKKKQHLIYAVSVGFGLVIAAQVAVGVTITVQQLIHRMDYPYVPVKVQHEVHNYLEDGMHHYQNTTKGKRIWDNLQISTCCCGIDGHDDWKMIAHTSIPLSCGTCVWGEMDQISANRSVPRNGCIKRIMANIGQHRFDVMQIVVIIVSSLTFLQFLAAIGPLFGVCCRRCCVPSTGGQVGMSDLNACPSPWRRSGNDDDDEPLLGDHDQGNHGQMAGVGEYPQATTHAVA